MSGFLGSVPFRKPGQDLLPVSSFLFLLFAFSLEIFAHSTINRETLSIIPILFVSLSFAMLLKCLLCLPFLPFLFLLSSQSCFFQMGHLGTLSKPSHVTVIVIAPSGTRRSSFFYPYEFLTIAGAELLWHH